MATNQHQTTAKTHGQVEITLLRLMTATHVTLYRWTNGVFGGRIAGNPVLLLTTVGRKSGKRRTRPLLFVPDGEAMVIVGSAGNGERHPFWWANLQANPRANVQVGRTTHAVEAEFIAPAVREQLWPKVIAAFPRFAEMQAQTSRELPLVRLRPV